MRLLISIVVCMMLLLLLDHIGSLTYRIFRAMSLRHLPVVDSSYHIVGIITRKDLLKPVVTKVSNDHDDDICV